MTHELKHIIREAAIGQKNGISYVLATVVDLDGSSYRKPGVRMLIGSNGEITGAVSGGCVEKEIIHCAQAVFEDGKPQIVTYDGRYRLGCEGLLYILLEPFFISEILQNEFETHLKQRKSFSITSHYRKEENATGNFGSVLSLNNDENFTFSREFQQNKTEELTSFSQTFSPHFKLLIIGAEHDAVKLCSMAALLGWEVEVVCSEKDPKEKTDFPGAEKVFPASPETLSVQDIDPQTAVVLMTHNYARDLHYLLTLKKVKPAYLGVLGSANRRDKLEMELFERDPNLADDFIEHLYSPAGLNLGAITPEEIALSILSEIIAVTREEEPFSLKTINGKIHS